MCVCVCTPFVCAYVSEGVHVHVHLKWLTCHLTPPPNVWGPAPQHLSSVVLAEHFDLWGAWQTGDVCLTGPARSVGREKPNRKKWLQCDLLWQLSVLRSYLLFFRASHRKSKFTDGEALFMASAPVKLHICQPWAHTSFITFSVCYRSKHLGAWFYRVQCSLRYW